MQSEKQAENSVSPAEEPALQTGLEADAWRPNGGKNGDRFYRFFGEAYPELNDEILEKFNVGFGAMILYQDMTEEELGNLVRDAIAIGYVSGDERNDFWHSIETAPKDGTFVLIFIAGGEAWCPIIARWNGDGWGDEESTFTVPGLNDPTHWMPLPQPPKAQMKSANGATPSHQGAESQHDTEDREKLAKWMIENSFATGHGDTIDDLLSELTWQVSELRARAFLKESED